MKRGKHSITLQFTYSADLRGEMTSHSDIAAGIVTTIVQTSCENRWFWPNPTVPKVQQWFEAGPFPIGGPREIQSGVDLPRKDEYLHAPSDCQLGIKKRGGKEGIEINGLLAITDTRVRFGNTEIAAQPWAKWASTSLKLEDSSLTTIRKLRQLRKFKVVENAVDEIQLGANEEIFYPRIDRIPESCNVEVTKLSWAENCEAMTLGFEAFRTLRTVEANLRKTIGYLSDRSTISDISDAVELSYPDWLARVVWSRNDRPVLVKD